MHLRDLYINNRCIVVIDVGVVLSGWLLWYEGCLMCIAIRCSEFLLAICEDVCKFTMELLCEYL